MYPYYSGSHRYLSQDDKDGIQSLYGEPDPLFAQVTGGPAHIKEDETGTWTAQISGGSGNYDIGWHKRPASGAIWDPACPGATTSCTDSFPDDENDVPDSGGIRITVADEFTESIDISVLPVTIGEDGDDDGGGGGGGGGGCNDVTGNQICQSHPAADLAGGQVALPEAFALEQSYPNPARPGQPVTIPFALPEAAEVTLALYDMLGREMRRIEGGTVGPGYPHAVVSTERLAGGVYVYRLTAGDQFTGTGKLVVVK